MKTILLAILLLSARCFAAIDVSSVATAGNGTAVSPWTGWDTAITWVGEQQYNFPSGVYAYNTSPNFLNTGIALVGEAGTILKHTGSGNAVVFDNPGGLSPNYLNWTQNVRFENFIVQGNSTTTNGLFLRGVRNGIFKHISIRDVSNAGLWSEACVTNVLENFRVTHHEMPNDTFNVVPKYGIVFSVRGGDTTTTWSVINPVIEGTSQIGIWTQQGSYGNTFINGTSEGNIGKGAVISSIGNTFINTDFEANRDTDIEILQSRNALINVVSAGTTKILAGQGNRVQGGQYGKVVNFGDLTQLQGVLYYTLSDNNGSSTIKLGNQGVMDGGLHFDSYLNNVLQRTQQLSWSAQVNTNASRFSSFYFVAFGDFLLANPTNGINGQAVTWRIQQDNVGGRVISFGSKFRSNGNFPVLSTVPLEFDYITALYNLARDTWDIH